MDTKVRRLLWTAPIAAALALAACGGSSGHAAVGTSSAQSGAATTGSRHLPTVPTKARHTQRVITTRQSTYGTILIDGGGRTIYLFTRDRPAASTCYGPCAAVWPPVLTKGSPSRTGGLTAAIGTTRRRNGAVQVTYGGHPLYYYVRDVRPGEILCQNVDEFGGTWLVVSPRGTPIR
jgi:predicted lipoprotein with Yx(FWY)xxD motif